jgi:hypothetical protein
MRIPTLSLLTILCLALSTTAFAGQFYNDGPTDGTTNGFFIDGPGGPFGQTISDGFFATASGTPGSIDFAEWTLTGTSPTTVTWALSGIHEFGSDMGSGTASGSGLTWTHLFDNSFGYSIYTTHIASLPGAGSMTAGNQYFLTLGGANDSGGTQFDAWDLNNGAATCFFAVGGVEQGGCGAGGESFTIGGCCGPPIPEPSSIMLFGSGGIVLFSSGIFGLVGAPRRRLNR